MQVYLRKRLQTYLRLYELNSRYFCLQEDARIWEDSPRISQKFMANKLIWHSTKPHKTAHGSIQNMLGFGKVNQEISLLHAPQKRRHRCNHLRQARILGLQYHWPPMPEDGLQNCAMRRWSPTISTPRHYHHRSRYVEYGGCGRRSC